MGGPCLFVILLKFKYVAANILIVEDETNLLELLLFNLEAEGYSCTSASNGKKALDLILHQPYDLLLLDVMLPELNGFELAEKALQHRPNTPIIFLTARSGDKDRITGLKSGAVDYVSKPFNLEELLLRIKVHLKHLGSQKAQNTIKIGDFEINKLTYEVSYKGQVMHEIGKKELQLLELLADNAGKVVSRDQIMSRIWGDEVETTSRTIDNYILNFRKWFHDDPKNPRYFHSIRGVGYKLTF